MRLIRSRSSSGAGKVSIQGWEANLGPTSEFGREVEAAFGFLRDLGFELAGDESRGSGAGIVTYRSPQVVLGITQENYNELDAFLAHRDVPARCLYLRAFSGLADNQATSPPVMFAHDRPRALRLLAELVRQYAGQAIAGDRVAFDQAARRQMGDVS